MSTLKIVQTLYITIGTTIAMIMMTMMMMAMMMMMMTMMTNDDRDHIGV